MLTQLQDFKLDFQNLHKGTCKVVDDIYFNAFQSNGSRQSSLCVSMEASGIFAVRDRYNRDDKRNIQAAEILVISDTPFSDGIDHELHISRYPQIERSLIHVGLETLLSVYKSLN